MCKYKHENNYDECLHEIILHIINIDKKEYLNIKYEPFLHILDKCINFYQTIQFNIESTISNFLNILSGDALIFLTTHDFIDERMMVKISTCTTHFNLQPDIVNVCVFLSEYFSYDSVFTPIFDCFINQISNGLNIKNFLNICIINEKISPRYAFFQSILIVSAEGFNAPCVFMLHVSQALSTSINSFEIVTGW